MVGEPNGHGRRRDQGPQDECGEHGVGDGAIREGGNLPRRREDIIISFPVFSSEGEGGGSYGEDHGQEAVEAHEDERVDGDVGS